MVCLKYATTIQFPYGISKINLNLNLKAKQLFPFFLKFQLMIIHSRKQRNNNWTCSLMSGFIFMLINYNLNIF